MESSDICGSLDFGIVLVLGDLATTTSGPNSLVSAFSGWLMKHGCDVTVVGTYSGARPAISELRDLFGQAHVVLHRRYFKDTWHFAPSVVGYAVRLLLSQKPHVLDIHGVWLFNGLLLGVVARLKRWSYFLTLHGNLRPVALNKNKTMKSIALKLFFKRWLGGASGLIALNEQEKSDAYEVLPETSFVVLSNAVRPHPDAMSTARRAEILFLGRMDPIKNLESLIDGFARISKQFPNWTLSIMGPSTSPSYLEELKSRSAKCGLDGKTQFHDAIHGVEKDVRMLSASIFALTSWSEGQPLAVLEAMAHGLPVLISDQCNINVPTNCGRVCGCSPEDIAQGLKEMLMMSVDELGRMGSEALRFVTQEFSEEILFKRRVQLYLKKG